MWSVSLIHWSVVLWWARTPNYLQLSMPLPSMCLWTIFRITFSNSLPVVNKRPIGRKFWGNFGSLPDFGNVITFSSSQGFGKLDSRRQWINICVRYASGLLGRCLRHSFGISSSPQAFLNSNEFDYLRTSQGFTFHNRVSSTNASRAWIPRLNCRSWLLSLRSWDVNWFSKQSAITLAFSFEWFVILKGKWIAVAAFGPS
jgi:hypothetical protein